jgi:hypothetical protein
LQYDCIVQKNVEVGKRSLKKRLDVVCSRKAVEERLRGKTVYEEECWLERIEEEMVSYLGSKKWWVL